MTRSAIAGAMALGVCSLFILGQSCTDFTFSFTFVTPDKAESTETQTFELPAGALVQIINDLGSTRVSVDPAATSATIEITREALANTPAEATALLDQMEVTITAPTAENNTLAIHAIRPAEATDDSSMFQTTITNDEMDVVLIVGSVQVASYRLRITLPPGHGLDLTQEVGAVRVVGLDTPSTVVAWAGSVRSIEARGGLAVTVTAGDVNIEDHHGSLALDVVAGDADVQIVSLAAQDQVRVDDQAGDISALLMADIDAVLTAEAPWWGEVHFSPGSFDQVTIADQSWSYVRATLGDGGATVDLTTHTGDIRIRAR